MYHDDNIFNLDCQLEDVRVMYKKGKRKKINPWLDKKNDNILLSNSYKRLKLYSKASRVYNCSSYLEFKRFNDNSLKLHSANFCKVRLCPMCAWRRTLKIFGQVSKVLEELDASYDFRFLTLTCQNVYGTDLVDCMDKLYKGIDRFFKRKIIKDTFVGHFRALEITYNKRTGQFHPHFHIILCSKSSYYKKHYIKQEQFAKIWQECLRVDYTPIVDIRLFKNGKKGVAEASKYTVKSGDYIVKSTTITDKMVSVLDVALANRRLIAFGGLLKDIHKKLNLGDAVDGDLVHTDNKEEENTDYIIEAYGWHVGLKNYYIIKK